MFACSNHKRIWSNTTPSYFTELWGFGFLTIIDARVKASLRRAFWGFRKTTRVLWIPAYLTECMSHENNTQCSLNQHIYIYACLIWKQFLIIGFLFEWECLGASAVGVIVFLKRENKHTRFENSYKSNLTTLWCLVPAQLWNPKDTVTVGPFKLRDPLLGELFAALDNRILNSKENREWILQCLLYLHNNKVIRCLWWIHVTMLRVWTKLCQTSSTAIILVFCVSFDVEHYFGFWHSWVRL